MVEDLGPIRPSVQLRIMH